MAQFQCLKCGFCCQLDVVLDKEDKSRLRAAGYYQFSRKRQGEDIMKKRGSYCMFYKNGCRVYDIKPGVCERFPFKNDTMSEHCRQNLSWNAQIEQKIVKFMNE